MPMVPAEVVLQLGTERLTARFSVSSGPMSPIDILPIARAIAERVINHAVAELPADKTVSCKAGCGACCRQLVPISEAEALQLTALVRDMSPERRQEILKRFRAAQETLRDAGMWDRLTQRTTWELDDVRRVGLEYFHLGIACPFLQDEACSIHPDRPISCREYLVTSDPVHCAEVRGEEIAMVPLAIKVSAAMNRMANTAEGDIFLPWVPLIQAIDWALSSPRPPIERPGQELIEDFFRKLANKPAVADSERSNQ